ncbi:hypothetical protein MBM_01776 [Drepanopeziza brunnea f. sp. 'multigermtubi' MB_m1]|uniref:Uncharacterized protein n=1 Tax=Marssonina brunnea f. sp. multigermtubi (strain MB_m1) TaxID=1072389 RepID=K1Y3Q6_MARBU|nr:uncharacterized protein MBM_01776 [Drepanopeziza brunnea f. sp. 'multigermtubi' MB_m1]EKD19824.1 hypothetical protein MBM_01776 [Drepanopeziza brunnea f. sp. 'multigermtubi' MB_m1]
MSTSHSEFLHSPDQNPNPNPDSDQDQDQDQGQPVVSSSALLRYPVPAADERVTNWVESITAAQMSAPSEFPSDEGNLGESTYEFVDTDTESRDDNATESVASTDFGRPDDVASLADTEGDESGDEDDAGAMSVPALQNLNHTVDEAFNTPTIARSSTALFEDLDKPLAQSIEFEEPYTPGAVSVKHTVAELSEDQMANAFKGMTLQDPPKPILITIRQTMTKQGLSTRDPLRILYVGSHSAKQDVIHKIASSVTASVEGSNRAESLRQSSSQLYNVVPISAFGSERTPEIELMHSSGYQIKVEDCTSAASMKFEDSPEKPDVIKMVLDENFVHHSVPEGQGFIVEPHWDLPHVAIFYCSDGDDLEARRTRTNARKFMTRHSIPSIVISHKQLFERGQCMSLDQHSIHMCLESRDSSSRGNVIHQRLPIDLASFLNIDARQMNRNLAFLTGLYDTKNAKALPNAPQRFDPSNPQDLEKTSYSVNFFRNRNGAALWRAVVPVSMLVMSVLIASLTGLPSYSFSKVASSPAMTINSKIVPAVSIPSSVALTSSASVPSITSLSSSVAAKASVKTVTVTQSIALASGSKSLSVLPSVDLGKAAQSVHVKPANKSYVCSAELLGDREILIRIPSATKLSWLAKEAMLVNITRNNVTVDTDRAYTSDEGIVLLLPKNEAYGVLNISITTTKKPRVNETFQLDLGSTASWQSFLNKLSSYLPEDSHFVDSSIFSHVYQAAEHMAGDAVHQSQVTLHQMEEAGKAAVDQAAQAGEGLVELAKSVSLEAAKRTAILSQQVGIHVSGAKAKLAKTFESSQHLRKPLDEGLVKAQIQSKLLWLKMQGKDEEYREYQRRAADLTRRKAEKLCKSQKATFVEQKKADWRAKKAAKKAALQAKKALS